MFPVAVRRCQVRLAVAVQVADRDRVEGSVRPRSRAWRSKLPSPLFRRTETRASRWSSRPPGPACRRRSGRRSRPKLGRSGCVVAPDLEAAVAPVEEHGDGARFSGSRSRGPSCRRRSGRRSRPTRVRSGSVGALDSEAAVAPVEEHGDGVAPRFAVARSSLPSPFRSPMATDTGYVRLGSSSLRRTTAPRRRPARRRRGQRRRTRERRRRQER